MSMSKNDKLMINYNLMNRVNEVNGKLQLNEILIDSAKFTIPFGVGFCVADYAFRPNHDIDFLTNLTISLSVFLGFSATRALVSLKHKEIGQFLSYLELSILAQELLALDVKTTAELLSESELMQTNYKPSFNNGGPVIKQNKYILVPTYDELGMVKETSLLQEHELCSREYVLSIGSPKKSEKTVPAFNM